MAMAMAWLLVLVRAHGEGDGIAKSDGGGNRGRKTAVAKAIGNTDMSVGESKANGLEGRKQDRFIETLIAVLYTCEPYTTRLMSRSNVW